MIKIRTLVVDDSLEFIKVVERYLSRSQQIELVDTALSGEEALLKAQAEKPDLILMDLIMPGINGVEAARRIKEALPQTTVMLLTLYDMEEYRTEAILAGADDLFHKSQLSDEWVDSIVEKMMAKLKKVNILVVDDSPTIRRMVIAALRPLGAEFGEASSGLEALEQLSLNQYDAMTLDLNMPDMHGIEVLNFLRGSERFRKIPIVVLTTRGDEDSREIALAGGANQYVTKPFRPDDLARVVKGLLNQ